MFLLGSLKAGLFSNKLMQFLTNLDLISEVFSFKALRTMLFFECCLFSSGSGVSFVINVMMGVGLLTGASL